MPKRWTDLDSGEHRLPEGFRRVGYDADERQNYFRDGDGRMWRSEPGNEYGVLVPVRPEPPVTIPRRPTSPQPPPYSKEPADGPLPEESVSKFKFFTNVLSSHRITSASSSTPKRSHTISIPTVASLKRSSTTATSFIKSRGKRFTKPEHSKKPSYDDSRRVTSAVIVRRSATITGSSIAAYNEWYDETGCKANGWRSSSTHIREPAVARLNSTTTGGGRKYRQE